MFFFPEKLSNYNKLDLSERNEKSVKRDGISILVGTVCIHSLFHRELERPISDINLANKVYSADKKIAIICFVENVGQEKKSHSWGFWKWLIGRKWGGSKSAVFSSFTAGLESLINSTGERLELGSDQVFFKGFILQIRFCSDRFHNFEFLWYPDFYILCPVVWTLPTWFALATPVHKQIFPALQNLSEEISNRLKLKF